MSTVATVPDLPVDVDALLAPIPGPSRAGTDVEYAPVFDEIKAARKAVDLREAEELESLRERARAARKQGDPNADRILAASRTTSLKVNLPQWSRVRDLSITVLTTQSKDLRVAISLLEALAHMNGFRGIAAGVQILRRLVDEYWAEVFPALDPEAPAPWMMRMRTLDWVDQRLPAIVAALPLTADRTKYTLQHVRAVQATGDQLKARIADGWASPQAVQKAIEALGDQGRDQLAADIDRCRIEAEALAAACEAKTGTDALSVTGLTKLLDECHKVVARAAPAPADAADSAVTGDADNELPLGAARSDDAIAKALELVRGGRIEGLRLAQEHLAGAQTGRQRFVRQLELAELCLEAGMHTLAYPLLDALGHTLEEHAIIGLWEEPALFVRVWSSLKRASDDVAAIRPEAADRAQQASSRLEALQPPPPAMEADLDVSDTES